MRINIIDGDSIIFYMCHNKKDEPEKTLSEIKVSLDVFINDILIKTESTHYIIYLTVGENHRKKVNPEYKANRKDLVRPKYFDEVKEYLITKHKAKYFYGYEADDLCLCTKKYYSKPVEILPGITGTPEVFYSTPDKDLLNLEGTHYNYKKGEWVKTSWDEAHEYFWKSMIIGDTSDGVKGIPGKGPKFANSRFKIHEPVEFPEVVLRDYTEHFGEAQGIEEFYKNYKSLKILDNVPDYVISEPVEFKVS